MLLDERAGSPPTATELLKRHADGHSIDSLEQLLREWEVWASELLESHMSYPMLRAFTVRSIRINRGLPQWLQSRTPVH